MEDVTTVGGLTKDQVWDLLMSRLVRDQRPPMTEDADGMGVPQAPFRKETSALEELERATSDREAAERRIFAASVALKAAREDIAHNKACHKRFSEGLRFSFGPYAPRLEKWLELYA